MVRYTKYDAFYINAKLVFGVHFLRIHFLCGYFSSYSVSTNNIAAILLNKDRMNTRKSFVYNPPQFYK